jgi:hypothetical protein
MPTITVRDETTAGKATNELTLEVLTERVTVRELIRSRVYQEVQDYNAQQAAGTAGNFCGLVQPTDAEVSLNGYKLKKPRTIEWKPQFEKACEAFEGNRILLLVDNRQCTELEEEVALKARSVVTFMRLVPLVGG